MPLPEVSGTPQSRASWVIGTPQGLPVTSTFTPHTLGVTKLLLALSQTHSHACGFRHAPWSVRMSRPLFAHPDTPRSSRMAGPPSQCTHTCTHTRGRTHPRACTHTIRHGPGPRVPRLPSRGRRSSTHRRSRWETSRSAGNSRTCCLGAQGPRGGCRPGPPGSRARPGSLRPGLRSVVIAAAAPRAARAGPAPGD